MREDAGGVSSCKVEIFLSNACDSTNVVGFATFAPASDRLAHLSVQPLRRFLATCAGEMHMLHMCTFYVQF